MQIRASSVSFEQLCYTQFFAPCMLTHLRGQGYLVPPNIPLMSVSRLIALPKANGDIHQIVIGDT